MLSASRVPSLSDDTRIEHEHGAESVEEEEEEEKEEEEVQEEGEELFDPLPRARRRVDEGG
eukprot:1590881-Rhodomonas_salina.3